MCRRVRRPVRTRPCPLAADPSALDASGYVAAHPSGLVFLDGVREPGGQVEGKINVEPGGGPRGGWAMWHAHQLVAILPGGFTRIPPSLRGVPGGSVIERQVGDMMLSLQLLEHVVGANLATLVHRMKQLGLEPEYPHFRLLPESGVQGFRRSGPAPAFTGWTGFPGWTGFRLLSPVRPPGTDPAVSPAARVPGHPACASCPSL